MKLTSHKRKIITSVLILSLLTVMLLTVTACEDFLSSGTTEETTEVNDPMDISTADEAELAVFRHLLAQADSPEAKEYLADFYTNCYNWSVQSEYFKDGSGIWLIEVDMTAESNWEFNPYWQRAAWFVYQDGSVIPSNLFKLNALRIEADLEGLGPKTETE